MQWTVFEQSKGVQYRPLHLNIASDYIPVVLRAVARDKAHSDIQKHERRNVVISFAVDSPSTLVVVINV